MYAGHKNEEILHNNGGEDELFHLYIKRHKRFPHQNLVASHIYWNIKYLKSFLKVKIPWFMQNDKLNPKHIPKA